MNFAIYWGNLSLQQKKLMIKEEKDLESFR